MEYEQKCAEEILQEAYGGTLANFIAALTGKDSITEIDKDELLVMLCQGKETIINTSLAVKGRAIYNGQQ